MDRLIEVRVNGHHLTKDNKNAGVQHEGNVTVLRIAFDEGWDGFAKTVTFWNALGNNPTKVVLTTNLLEDITVSTRVYLCPIPMEAMTEAGKCSFVIDGYIDGKRQRSVSDELAVLYAPYATDAGEASDPTPTQAEQLQKQFDGIMGDIQQAAISEANAKAYAQAASVSKVNAKASEVNAEYYYNRASEIIGCAFRLVDDVTGELMRLGSANGILYAKKTQAGDPVDYLLEDIEHGTY